MYDDIIPDSEPEREDRRRHLDEGRTVKRTRKRQAAESTRSVSLVLSSSPEPDLSVSFDFFFSAVGSIPLERTAVNVVAENPF